MGPSTDCPSTSLTDSSVQACLCTSLHAMKSGIYVYRSWYKRAEVKITPLLGRKSLKIRFFFLFHNSSDKFYVSWHFFSVFGPVHQTDSISPGFPHIRKIAHNSRICECTEFFLQICPIAMASLPNWTPRHSRSREQTSIFRYNQEQVRSQRIRYHYYKTNTVSRLARPIFSGSQRTLPVLCASVEGNQISFIELHISSA